MRHNALGKVEQNRADAGCKPATGCSRVANPPGRGRGVGGAWKARGRCMGRCEVANPPERGRCVKGTREVLGRHEEDARLQTRLDVGGTWGGYV